MTTFPQHRPISRSTANFSSTGTLMWIGERSRPEYSGVFRDVESKVAQLALRQDIDDALDRKASDVACIIVTRETRTALQVAALEALQSMYPDATMIQILGSLCEGERPRINGPFEDHTLYWHQCNQFLPGWLKDCGVTRPLDSADVNSVAVVASTIQIADPLMELAASFGAAAFWCRQPNTFIARNFDAIWWDDSVATPVSAKQWQTRIAAMNTRATTKTHTANSAQHAWIASNPRIQAVSAAQQAGINFILSKPANIDTLLQTIAPASTFSQDTSALRAA